MVAGKLNGIHASFTEPAEWERAVIPALTMAVRTTGAREKKCRPFKIESAAPGELISGSARIDCSYLARFNWDCTSGSGRESKRAKKEIENHRCAAFASSVRPTAFRARVYSLRETKTAISAAARVYRPYVNPALFRVCIVVGFSHARAILCPRTPRVFRK